MEVRGLGCVHGKTHKAGGLVWRETDMSTPGGRESSQKIVI